MQIPDIIIAIDGYSSTGKSSFAKLIATHYSFLYLDSGALYRGVTLYAIENELISDDCKIDLNAIEKGLKNLDLHFEKTEKGSELFMGNRCIEKEIRTLAVSDKVSPIATIPFVRDYVNLKLREFGKRKRIVMDGRDIGTTVFPHAELKIFMTADPMVRAQRRAAELLAKGELVRLDDVYKNLQERDHIDSNRETSPLSQADDAIVLDNTNMTMEQQLVWVDKLIQEKFSK